ncbi:synaptotagmin-like protein 2 isoform X2 [Nannospalax galili]|uniref:synaptotagmin-like protein 2 isoform X2 n=1 Tax=Nannospalax galili TaxID=1026970 RepID=UPI00111C2583|nr:synaptotagmin-like protein 2 isoform X2 [Nannospalax galili]
MIDLSFLTDEEQEAIMKVLQRDAALKRAEEERVRHLPEKIKDDQQLKNMSGQWFYEAKAKRHRDKIHGADIIRASMRKKRAQLAAEQGKDKAVRAKESWVDNVNQDAFLPPEPAVVEDPKDDTAPAGQSSSVVNPAPTVIDTSQENTRKSTVSPPKQRKNPFNISKLPEDHLSQQNKDEQSKNGRTGLFQISKEGDLSESKEKTSNPDISSQALAKPKQPMHMELENGSQIKVPIPKARKLIYKSNNFKQDERRDSLNARGAPRGILKRNSSSSSTDSETLRFNHNFDPKSKLILPGLTIHERISEKDHSLEDASSSNSLEPLKHVRFSAVKEELPWGPRLVLGQEVGEFSVLESDRLQNGTEVARNTDEFQNHHPKPSHRKPLSFHQSVSSPSISESETHQPVISGSVSNDGLHCHSEVLPASSQSVENSPTVSEHQDKSPDLTRLESEWPQSPADELSQNVEPEPSQLPDHSFRDHQQGKPLLVMALNAQPSSHSGPCATEIRKTTDDSISKVLDWFNRSSHSEDSKSSLQHLQEIDFRQKTDSESQVATDSMNSDTCLKEDNPKALPSTKVKLQPVRSDPTFHSEGDTLIPVTCRDNDVNIKSNSMNLSQQGTAKEGPDTLQSFEFYGTLSQGSKNINCNKGSKSTGEGSGAHPPNSNYAFHGLQGSDTEVQVPCNTKHTISLDKEDPKLHVLQKNKANSCVNFDSSIIVQESILNDNVRRKRKNTNASVLKTSLATDDTELPLGAANSGSHWKKPEVQLQQEVSEPPKNQVLREKYKRVSDRILFWEGEKTGAKLKAKELTSSCSQEPSNTNQPEKLQGMTTDSSAADQSDYSQVTAKRVVFDEDDQAPHLSSFNSSNKPKKTWPPISGPSKKYPSADQSDRVSPFQNKMNKHIKRLPMEDSSHSRTDGALSTLQYPLNTGNEIRTFLEKDRSVIDKSIANFKVLSLKERTDEPNTEQVYNHSQFENLRKFWDLGANPNTKDNDEKNITTSKQNSMPFNSQKSKEFNDMKSSGENTHKVEGLLNQKNIMATEDMEKLNSKCTLQMSPEETTFPLKPPRKFTYQLVGNESTKENVEKTMGCFVTPVIKEEKDCSDQEVQEAIVKTSIFSKDSKDTFNDSLQRLLSEALSPAIQPSGGNVHEQVLKVGVSENRTWSEKKDFAENEKEITGPEASSMKCANKIGLPKAEQSALTADLNRPREEAAGTSPAPLQSALERVTTRANSQSAEDGIFEKWIKQNHSSTSADQRGRTAPFLEGEETSGSTVLTQSAGNCERRWLSEDGALQQPAEGSRPLAQPSQPHTESPFEEVSNSPPNTPFSWDTCFGPQDGALPSQREISETMERTVLPSKAALNDVNAALQRLLREAGEARAERCERVQAAGSPSGPLRATAQRATVDAVQDFDFFCAAPDKAHEEGFYLSAQKSPSEFPIRSPQHSKELPQEVAETVREMIIQPKSECIEFRAGLEKLLKETLEISPSKYEKDTGTISPSEMTGSCGMPKQVASEFHHKEIQETIEKAETPPVTESAFDTGLEKLLKELSEAPCQLQQSVKGDTFKKQPSQAEQSGFWGVMPHFGSGVSRASKMVKSSGLESQVNQGDKLLGGDKAVTGPSDICVYSSGVEVPETSELYVDHEIETIKTIRPPENRGGESVIAGQQGASQEHGVEEAPKEMSVFRNKQPVSLPEMKENSTKMSEVELILQTPCERRDKEQEAEGPSESEFSDGNTSSNAESWRNASSSEEEPSPVLKTLERSAARKMPSQSLEDISSNSSNQAKVDNLPEELVRSAEDVSTVPSLPDNQFSHPEKLKRMSKSVPAFLQDESDDRETDTASESSYQHRRYKKSPSSLTNLSSSSGMTSSSSVSGSVMSVYSGDFGNLEVKGNIQFAVDYVESLKELHVFVAQCKDLAAADAKKQRSDPYVKTYLLPDKGKMGKKKTLVMKKTLNPVYNEILRYKIEKQFLKTQKLNLSVWHRDTFKRNSFLGEVELDLETWDWDNKQNKQLKWYPLKRKTAPVALETENRGEMKLALQYVPEPAPGKKLPTTGEVHIWVKECLDLPLLRGSQLNSFVKCTILPDTSRKSRQKTRAVGKTTNPIFNHTMVYDGFRPEDLMEACVELTVWDHYKLTNQFLGGLRIGFGTGKSYGTEVDWMDSTSEEVALWEKMVNSPNTWIEATLPLRMLLIAKISK